jgi:hypothetical protein
VRERRGTVGRMTGIAESVAAGVRRRRRDRVPRVVLYDAAGHPRVLPPGAAEHAAIVEVAERLLEAAIRERGPDGEPLDEPASEGEAAGEPGPGGDPSGDPGPRAGPA